MIRWRSACVWRETQAIVSERQMPRRVRRCHQRSARSTLARRWSEAMTRTDSVLAVDDIARAATRIGRSVTIERIEGAIHDVFLSAPASRDAAYAALERWLLQGALAR